MVNRLFSPTSISPSRKRQEVKVKFRRIILKWDIEQIMLIENECFKPPRTRKDFIDCLGSGNHAGIVATTVDYEIIGLVVYEFSDTQIHITSIAVKPNWQRHNIGTRIIEKMKEELLSPGKRTRIVLEVRETNLAAQLFFRENEFHAFSILHNFYADYGLSEDAYLMQYRYGQLKQRSEQRFFLPERRLLFL